MVDSGRPRHYSKTPVRSEKRAHSIDTIIREATRRPNARSSSSHLLRRFERR
jgi:hypothetical protein